MHRPRPPGGSLGDRIDRRELKAEIYSYSRSRGPLCRAALDGSALTIDNDANQSVYGEGVTARRIFEGGRH